MKWMDKIKQWKEMAAIVIMVSAGFIWFSKVETKLAYASEQTAQAASKADKLESIVTKLDNQFYMLLQLHGISEDKIKQWKEMPKNPPFDSIGKPILRTTWLWISPDFQQGKLMQFDSVWVQEVQAWNLEARK